MKKSSAVILVVSLFCCLAGAQNRAQDVVKEKMKELSFFCGKWKASAVFHSREVGVPGYTESGTYNISWALDSTYLKWEIEFQDTSKPKTGMKRFMLILMTYNALTETYEQHSFQNSSTFRVFETGDLDKIHNEFRTVAFFPMEDGIRDENVRSVTIVKPPEEIIYEHYSRYSDELEERNDFSVRLYRIKQN
jgi:hypothetical protein